MVRHQAITQNLHAELHRKAFQPGEKKNIVRRLAEHPLAAVPPVHHVIEGTGILHAQWPGHLKLRNRGSGTIAVAVTLTTITAPV